MKKENIKIVFSEILKRKVESHKESEAIQEIIKEKIKVLKLYPEMYRKAHDEEYREIIFTLKFKIYLLAYYYNKEKGEIFLMNIKAEKQNKYTKTY